MQVTNHTRNTILAKNLIVPKSFLDRIFGLLKYKTPIAMLLRTRFGIHTFGMHYPIDVVVLNKQNLVVAIKRNVKPNKIFVWNVRYKKVIELPINTINNSKTEIGDTLLL